MPDKFERSGLHAIKSDKVDAPIAEEFSLTLECKVVEIQHDKSRFRVLGEIVNVLADETVLDAKGNVDPTKLNAFVFDQFQSGYYAIGEKVGQAWSSGASFMKNKHRLNAIIGSVDRYAVKRPGEQFHLCQFHSAWDHRKKP